MRSRDVFIRGVLGIVIIVIVLLIVLSRIQDTGIVSIILTVVAGFVFFVLSLIALEGSSGINNNTDVSDSRNQKIISRPLAILFLAVSILILTAALMLMFQIFKSQLMLLSSMGEITFHTSRAEAALMLTVGGCLAILYWIPGMMLAGFLIGRVSARIGYWDCGLSVFSAIGTVVVAIFITDFYQGELSVEHVLASIFNEESTPGSRLSGELLFFIIIFVSSFLVIYLLLSIIVWVAVEIGRRTR